MLIVTDIFLQKRLMLGSIAAVMTVTMVAAMMVAAMMVAVMMAAAMMVAATMAAVMIEKIGKTTAVMMEPAMVARIVTASKQLSD